MTASSENAAAKIIVCEALKGGYSFSGNGGFITDSEGKKFGVAVADEGDWKIRQFYIDQYEDTFFVVVRGTEDVYKCTKDITGRVNRISPTLGSACTVFCEKPIKIN